jgi:hypothetical protein
LPVGQISWARRADQGPIEAALTARDLCCRHRRGNYRDGGEGAAGLARDCRTD